MRYALNFAPTLFSKLFSLALAYFVFFSTHPSHAQILNSSATGTKDGFYYSFWKDSGDSWFELLENGQYRAEWNNGTNSWYGGLGWNPGVLDKVVHYEGGLDIDATSQLAWVGVYGWMKDPFVEYFIVESYTTYNPARCNGPVDLGSYYSDGATYNVNRCRRYVNAIDGPGYVDQYYAVRDPLKDIHALEGTIHTENFFTALQAAGVELTERDFMILATEGYQSNGSVEMTVSEVEPIRRISLSENAQGVLGGFFYLYWKDSGIAAMTAYSNGRYELDWDTTSNNIVGGIGWNPGSTDYTVGYSGYFGVNSELNAYLSLYGWTTDPLVEYYILESYGSYNPANCTGKTDLGTYTSDGATYNLVRCPRPAAGLAMGPDQYYAIRTPKKGYGLIDGVITVANHFDALINAGVELGTMDYMIMATEGYNSAGSSDITVTLNPPQPEENVGVRMRGVEGNEQVHLTIGDETIATWILTTHMTEYWVNSDAKGEVRVVFDNDSGGSAVQVDYISIDGEIREAEDQWQNTGAFLNYCGGGYNSEMLDCNGFIGFGLREQNSATCEEKCQWYFSGQFPLCINQDDYWGWENNASCIGRNSCSQQFGFGGIVWHCPD